MTSHLFAGGQLFNVFKTIIFLIEILTGIAGVSSWLACFPADIIKSRMQSDAIDISNRKYSGWLDCVLKTYRNEGITGFTSGLGPCLFRAFPVCAVLFTVQNFSSDILNSRI